MFNLKSTALNAFCAMALALTSLAASASVIPTYHVAVNTSAFAGQTGYLDLSFGGTGATAGATVSNFSSGFGAVDTSVSMNYGTPSAGVYSLANAPTGYLSQNVNLGGILSFDVAFAGDFTSVMGDYASAFVVFLFDSNINAIGDANGVASFGVKQLSSLGVTASVNVTTDAAFATATPLAAVAVPEPADWLLMLTGLVFVVYMTRLNGRTNARRLAAAA